MARKKKGTKQLTEHAKAVSEKAFYNMAQVFKGNDCLISAFNFRDGIWVFVGSFNHTVNKPEFYLGPYMSPNRDGLYTTPLEPFLASSREYLLKFHLDSLVDLMEECTHSTIAPERLITEMRAHWTEDRYHKKKNEQEKLDDWLRSSDQKAGKVLLTGRKTAPVNPDSPSKSTSKSSSCKRRKPRRYASGLRICIPCLPVAFICGYLFGSRIDNASPVDGAMIGAVMGLLLYLLIANWGCGTLRTGCMIGLFLSILMFCIGHIQGYRMERDWIEARYNRTYKAYLSEVLEQNNGYIFIAHLRAMAKLGTAAVEKPYAYMTGKRVVRKGWEVWFAWAGQLLWCVFFTWVGVFFGHERHITRTKTDM